MHTVALATAGHLLHFELGIAYEIFGNPPLGVEEWYEVRAMQPLDDSTAAVLGYLLGGSSVGG